MAIYVIAEGPKEKELRNWQKENLKFRLMGMGWVNVDVQVFTKPQKDSYKMRGEVHLIPKGLCAFEAYYNPKACQEIGSMTIYND